MKILSSVIKAALDLRHLNDLFGTDTTAEEVISAALVRNEREVVARIADRAEAYASRPGDFDPEFSWVLAWFASELRKELPSEDQVGAYTPANGDLVELVLTGEISEHRVRMKDGGSISTWLLLTEQMIEIALESDDFPEFRVHRLAQGSSDTP